MEQTQTYPINIKKSTDSRIDQFDLDNPGFGKVFSDHVFSMEYHDGQWHNPEILPYGKFEIAPSLASLHYGQSVFEGMKAFRAESGEINIFRPDKHFTRLNQSCRRLCIPETDYDTLTDGLETLIRLDAQWVPSKRGNALYIRPLIFSTDEELSVKAAQTYRFLIMTSPVGAYYKEGINPVRLVTSGEYVRSVKGGAGFAKTAGNYASSILPAQIAKSKGYTQVLWLDALEHQYVEEVGTMNIFFKIDNRLITPPLEGSILGGITRESVIELAHDWGITVEERRISIDEVFDAFEDGTLQECFGTGTAAVISPVGRIDHNNRMLVTNEHRIGPFAQKLYNEITGIQYGEKVDRFNWLYHIT